MLELGISQAQAQFTKLLDQTVLIVDKKAHHKKAVILPYEEYKRLVMAKTNTNKDESSSLFSKYVGVLEHSFTTDDIKYNEIVS